MRGLILAVLALLIVAGDSGRYVPQLLRNTLHSVIWASPSETASDSETNSNIPSSNTANARDTSYNEGLNNATFALLWHAAIQGSEDAQALLLQAFESAFLKNFSSSDATQADTRYWLEKLVKLENADAAWLLYQMQGEEGTSERFMYLAAVGGVPEAQFAYAMATELPETREKWLNKAAQQQYAPAQAALADWYLLHGKQQLAKPLLATTATLDMQSAFKYGRLLWDEGQHNQAKSHFAHAAELGHKQAKRALVAINKYTARSLKNVPPYDWAKHSINDKTCLQRIQPFATSLATIIHADTIYQSFLEDERLEALSLCIAPPIWLENKALTCNADYKGRGVLGCDVTPLSNIAKTRKFSHAVVIAEQGKANVQNGVMYLDISDAYSVFVHELAHFAGFADEYPMNRSMARQLCQEDQIDNFSPPNIIIDSDYWYAPHETVNNWLDIDPATIIARSKTCELVGKRSYKPSRRITFMEHHDSGVIPPLYLVLWQQQLTKQNAQRPISMNFFQAFHKSGNQKEAAHWLAQYEAYITK